MQITPQHAAATVQARPQNPRRLTARPPQENSRHHQHHAPTGGHFDQPVTDGADHQFAVEGAGDGLQILLGILLAEDVAVVRIDEYIQLLPGIGHDKLRTAPSFTVAGTGY